MLYLVNFGISKASLSTVGYALYDADGTLHTARSTTGVTERPAGSGTYGVDVTLPSGFVGEIRWDTGEATPAYASEAIDGGGELSASLLSGTLTTIARVRAVSGIGTYTDDQITIAINSATDAIKHYCNRDLISTTYTNEYYDGNGRDVLYLRNYPITAIASLTVDDIAITSAEYLIEDQGLFRIGGWWSSGRRNIKITYTAGYTSIPDELATIASKVAGDILAQAVSDPSLQSEKIGDYSYSINNSLDVAVLSSTAVKKYICDLSYYKRWAL